MSCLPRESDFNSIPYTVVGGQLTMARTLYLAWPGVEGAPGFWHANREISTISII